MSEFIWKVAANGYAWADDYRNGHRDGKGRRISEGRVLIPLELLKDVKGADGAGFEAIDDRGVAYRTYDPFQETGLFCDFARTAPTEIAILAFANKYGTLGADSGADVAAPVPGVKMSEEQRDFHRHIFQQADIAQSFERWRDAITHMNQAVALYSRLPPDRKGHIAKQLQTLIEEQLQVTGVIARFRLDPLPTREPPLHLCSLNLHGAMWLQLARVVSGNKELRHCVQCDRTFEVSPEVTRSSRIYCSERCRAQAYRKRKSTARMMRASGKTLRHIAEELDSDVETVKGWIEEGSPQ